MYCLSLWCCAEFCSEEAGTLPYTTGGDGVAAGTKDLAVAGAVTRPVLVSGGLCSNLTLPFVLTTGANTAHNSNGEGGALARVSDASPNPMERRKAGGALSSCFFCPGSERGERERERERERENLPLPLGAPELGPLGWLAVPNLPTGWTSLKAGGGLSPTTAAVLIQRPVRGSL